MPDERDRTMLSRFELKYVVSDHIVPSLRAFMRPLVTPDAYSERRPDLRYTIGSLYLDSADRRLCRMTQEGIKNRFKVRVRSYVDDPLAPVFCEIKHRVDRIMMKRRAPLGREHLEHLLAGRLPPREDLGDKARRSLEEFCRLVVSGPLAPVMRVRYQREAYVSVSGEPLRLTLDTALSYAVTKDRNVSLTDGKWVDTPVGGTILEIKFNHRYSSWVSDMVAIFQLQRRSVPKYVLCMEHAGAARRSIAPLAGLARRGRELEA